MNATTMPVDAAEPMMTKGDLARRLRESARNVERRMRSGNCPPYIRVGKRALWSPATVNRWLEEHSFASLANEQARELLREQNKGEATTNGT